MITPQPPEILGSRTPEGAVSQHAIDTFCDEELALKGRRDSFGAFLGTGEDAREALGAALERVTADGSELPDSAWDLLKMHTYIARTDNPSFDETLLQKVSDRSAKLAEDLHLDTLDYVVQTNGLSVMDESFELGIPDMPWVTITAGYVYGGYNMIFSFFDGPPSDTEERKLSRQVLVDVYTASEFTKEHMPADKQTPLLGLAIRDSAEQTNPGDIHYTEAVSQSAFSDDIAETIDFCLTNAYVRALSRKNEREDVWDETNNTWVRAIFHGVPAATKLRELGISQLGEDGTPLAVITPDARDKDLHIKSARELLATTTTYVPGYGGHVSVNEIVTRLSPDKLAFLFPHLVEIAPSTNLDAQE